MVKHSYQLPRSTGSGAVEDDPSAAAGIKRGPGRPPKPRPSGGHLNLDAQTDHPSDLNPTFVALGLADDPAVAQVQLLPKRGRGRPPKLGPPRPRRRPGMVAAAVDLNSGEGKRSRGRPKKERQPSLLENAVARALSVKRRGRPPGSGGVRKPKKLGARPVGRPRKHRYYGKSSPFQSLITENLRYLSSKQALFDLAAFRDYYQKSLTMKTNKTNTENPWFVFGVSYAGPLSAWFRLKFPHLTCGSLASSAVIEAIYNFTEFDHQIGESAGPKCKAALQETNHLVEQRLASNGEALKASFDAAELKDDADFLYFLADVVAVAFQYGNPDTLCSPLLQAKQEKKDLVDAYSTHVKDYYLGSFGANVQTYNQEYLKKTIQEHSSDRLWWFQVCSEVANFQVAPSNDSMRSLKIERRHFSTYHILVPTTTRHLCRSYNNSPTLI